MIMKYSQLWTLNYLCVKKILTEDEYKEAKISVLALKIPNNYENKYEVMQELPDLVSEGILTVEEAIIEKDKIIKQYKEK